MTKERPPRGYAALRRLLFRLEAERAHGAALAALRLAGAVPGLCGWIGSRKKVEDPRLAQEIWGRRFANPVGLAAGFDKDGVAVRALAALGFGFLEVGTVTPEPQSGNPRPRLFRYPEAESLENALGFNNSGGRRLAGRLERLGPPGVPLGVNVGKNRATPLERAGGDYEMLIETFADRCDYLVINVSSPNTPGLRELQNRRSLEALLAAARRLTERPLLVKVSPDLTAGAAIELCGHAVEAGASGVIVANTTTDYPLLPGARAVGGISGRAVREKSLGLLRAVARELAGRTVLIGVGGIDSAAEAYRRLRAGASLVQLYTGLVYRGPDLVRRINRGLLELLDRDGLAAIGDSVGADL